MEEHLVNARDLHEKLQIKTLTAVDKLFAHQMACSSTAGDEILNEWVHATLSCTMRGRIADNEM